MRTFVRVGSDGAGRSTVDETIVIDDRARSTTLVGGLQTLGPAAASEVLAEGLLDLASYGVDCSPGTLTWSVFSQEPNEEFGMHYTTTIDLDHVVAGTTTLILEDGEVSLGPGDCVLIPGVPHAWRSGQDGCVLSTILIGIAGP
jgi:mannose-6-phosphate isomerase-like protein (cupin superfamily)